MPDYEVPEPILNSPYEEPAAHWNIEEGASPEKRPGRRPAGYFFRDPKAPASDSEHDARGSWEELKLVNLIRERIKQWRSQGYPGVTRTTFDLLNYWQRDGRQHRLFFAQLEAAEAIIFLNEARADFRQGIQVPSDEPSDEAKAKGIRAFTRYACKMATGAGKTTVMGMVAAWSILNKVNDRSDGRFSDAVLIVCPNVTIRNRLGELHPETGEASLYRTRDLVPEHLMADLTKGRVVVTNWHVFEPQSVQTGGTSGKVIKAGVPVRVEETITIGARTTTARGKRYLTPDEVSRQAAAGLIKVLSEEKDKEGNLKRVRIESYKYVESDTAVVNRVIGKEVGGKQNILVFNDEAHHAYRIRQPENGDDEEEEDDSEQFFKEATVWVEGLDRIHKLRGINFCLDLSATPYFLGRVGQETNRTFPWVVSDFGLTDAIESGLTKIPQLVVRDTTGNPVPSYFNIWRWILTKLTPSERGGKRANPKPEAVLKYASTPILMLAGLWEELRAEWERDHVGDPRPPVFIIVCKNTKIADVIYKWLGENDAPSGIAPAKIAGFLNNDNRKNTIRVDSKVIAETDTGEAKSDESAWMRLTLDTVGKTEWPKDRQGRSLYPENFEELANKLKRPLHPPGRDVRCIVSVGMLTEGWDCNTVTHIVGLRPFMSQLLCEQVVGRGLRRSSYEVGEDGRLTEEVAKVFGVPFEIIPFKENKGGAAPSVRRHHIHSLPEKAAFEIKYPRVEGYRQAIRNRVTIDWNAAPTLTIDPMKIPPEVEVKATLPSNKGRHSLSGPGKLEKVDLNPYRSGRRFQELVFDMAAELTREYVNRRECEAPAHVLFPQMRQIVDRYLREKVQPLPPAQTIDVFCSPYYGWVIEHLRDAIKPDVSQGEAPIVPIYETRREPGSTGEVDFWTSREVREVVRSHVNYVVADTKKWEESAAYFIDTNDLVDAFAKNAGLGFAIPYFHNGEAHDYVPDFIVRLKTEPPMHLILEVKGYDELQEVKAQAAQKWVEAVNADRTYGRWAYAVARKPSDVKQLISDTAISLARSD
ncbi:MAG: DEAD/DEAH box helicase family protein [Candidatus Binatus sp.]|uniref:BPTD_3080 family restriction endonuclease n=1 Tax=Candidatus Binatus sp. TaxID=2811406 RepID=UPI00271EC272|nr:DEAD/DEAH box helicase family protein [Candidatus Binatus sp.]MDO8432455.1 DEAD/DEAH box helicase family protein [Candidatus Binatus sp.]